MQNKKWKRFEKLTGRCYSTIIGAETDRSCWTQAFQLLKEIVLEERQKDPGFASQLEQLDDVTDYEYDVQGWLEDCLDEIDMRGDYEQLLQMCDDLLQLFGWPDYTDSDIRFRKSSALSSLGRKNEAAEYCRKWIKKEPENVVAAAAGVYAFIGTKEFAAAEELIDRFIPDKTECSEENDIMFTAASKLYEATGKQKEKKQIDKAIQDYEEYLKEYFESEDCDDDEFDFFDESDLPFD